eukprot:TRINITY_DN3005_c0_g1_i3.p1 TRINITY_DN3005_c0_g1~~TRINITY_DN3005_c0_g1_i3.p1  ORF type:complete len:247 (+),score=38.48 TRINITY_DN3005_c0_g1_i3:92-832(+)
MIPLNYVDSYPKGGTGLNDYFRRIVHYRQMDFEYTFWQMFNLMYDPSVVFRMVKYHKQTKNQWARDDPAFVVVLVFFMAVSSLAFSVAFEVPGISTVLRIMVGSILVDFLGFGVLMATAGWWIANKYLKEGPGVHSVDQDVEWLFAFDIHCNAYMPPFLILYVLQYFAIPILLQPTIFACILANTAYAGAVIYYHYIFFLGYNSLPFLKNQTIFLLPVGVILVIYLISLALRWNIAIFALNWYFGA